MMRVTNVGNVWGSLAVLFLGLWACQPSQSKLVEGKFETYVVDKGNIETWESSEGVVEPANEVIVLSPASSVIKEIVKEPGQQVKKGEVIVRLDTRSVEDRIEQLNDQLAVKHNSLEKTRLSARSTKADLSYNAETKKLKISSIKATLADQEQLLEVGGISQARYDKTKQELVLAQKELQLVQQKNAIRLAQLAADEKGLLLQIDMQQKDLIHQTELLQKMEVIAPSDGIILEVKGREGEKIAGDRLLVNMSDLTRLKIRATIDSKYKNMIKTGRRAYVMVDNAKLEGRIGTIKPVLENDNLQFSINLLDSKHPKLIPNQKVDIQIVKRARHDVLRLKVGSLLNDKKVQKVFIVNGDSANRKELKFGLITDEYLEIKEGLEEGTEVVISASAPINDVASVAIEKQ